MRGQIFSLFIVLLTTLANGSELPWMTHYGRAVERTKTQSKPLLIIFEKSPSKGGGPRPSQTASLTNQADSSDLLNKFVLCRIDATTRYGSRVATAFKIDHFPCTVIVDRVGRRIIFQKTGQFSTPEWTAILARFSKSDWASAILPNAHSIPRRRGRFCPT